jgi:putative lipase involved disintegration of autophagic bodies
VSAYETNDISGYAMKTRCHTSHGVTILGEDLGKTATWPHENCDSV